MPQVSVSAGVTRMLLSSDGSTTILLEALLECPLVVLVESQQMTPVSELPEVAVTALGLKPGDPAVERRSALVAPDGVTASMHTVVFAASPAAGPAPPATRLREARTRQHREVLSYGVAEWPGGDKGRPCAYKEYEIVRDEGVQLYVHERFHPDHVPPPAEVELLTATGRDAV